MVLNTSTEETSANGTDGAATDITVDHDEAACINKGAASTYMEVLEAGDPGPVTDPDILTEAHKGNNNQKRWRRSDPSKWKKNVAKHMHIACQPYSTKKGYQPAKYQIMLTVQYANSNVRNTSQRKTEATLAKLTWPSMTVKGRKILSLLMLLKPQQL
jgi:hypothetical protein